MDPTDLDRLARVRRLAAVPARERTDEWIRNFEGAFWPAPLVMFEPRTVEHQGHGLLRVSARSWREGFDFVRPAALVDRLIDEGRGLVLTDEGDVTQVWLSLGEVLSYRLYGRAFAMLPPPGDGNFRVSGGERIGAAPPSEATFPSAARPNVRRHLQNVFGIAEPRACWVRFETGKSGIVLDLSAVRGLEGEAFRRAFDGIRWLLPARIDYFRLDLPALAAEMRPF